MAKSKKGNSKKNTLDVKFTEDIPKITREGTSRSSKYQPLLDKCRDKADKAARLTFETRNESTSRYQSIRDLTKKQEDADHWEVAQRTLTEDDEETYNVFVKFHSEPPSEDE